MDTLFLITHTSTFNIALQALTLIQHILASLSSAPSTSSAADGASAAAAVAVRYFRTLYNTLLDFRLYESSKQAMYLNLLFKSVKSDADAERVRAFVKRFCQVLVGGFGGAEFVAGGLWLLGEVRLPHPTLIPLPLPMCSWGLRRAADRGCLVSGGSAVQYGARAEIYDRQAGARGRFVDRR